MISRPRGARRIGVRLVVIAQPPDAKAARRSPDAANRLNVKPELLQSPNRETAKPQFMLQGRVILRRSRSRPDDNAILFDGRAALLGTVERDASLREHRKPGAVFDLIFG